MGVVTSPLCADFECKTAPSSDGAGPHISSRKNCSVSNKKRAKSCQSESASSNGKNISESSDSEIRLKQDTTCTRHSSSPPKTSLVGKSAIRKRNSKRVAERVLVCMRKRQKKMAASDSDSILSGGIWPRDMKLRSNSRKENEDAGSSSLKKVKPLVTGRSRRKCLPVQDNDKLIQPEAPEGQMIEVVNDLPASSSDDTLREEDYGHESMCKQEKSDDKSWKAIEKGFFEKGVEIFGRNRSVCIMHCFLMDFFGNLKVY